MPDKHNPEQIKKAVRTHYATAITTVSGGCCGPKPAEFDPEAVGRYVKLAGYTKEDLASAPESATTFGCGNPVSFIEVTPGQTVLDLGSGAGLDLILASRKVGPTGKVIGLDMTPEMITVCRRNLELAGIANAEVRFGEMEQMPVANSEVDWIISNCVINLSPEKTRVFAECYRVLKPGGRMLVSDIVTSELPESIRTDLKAWAGCIGGAVEETEYIRLVKAAGFEDVRVVDRLVYDAQSLNAMTNDACGCWGDKATVAPDRLAPLSGKVASIKLSARKPG